MQVQPKGDRWVNRKPDVLILRPEHLTSDQRAIFLEESPPPAFVAEVVSPGGETSDNYQRDYVWKRHQYQDWQIPEYWIIDPHRRKVTVLTLTEGSYKELIYQGQSRISSITFPALRLSVEDLLSGEAT